MGIIKFENARVGEIYVTQGGLVQDIDGNILPWGYERVQLIKKDRNKQIFIFKTPWGTEVEINGDYILYDTPETSIRSEHKMIRLHKGDTIQRITFDEALEQGFCTLEINPQVEKSSQLDVRQNIINFFSTSQKIADCAYTLNIQYPRVRAYIQSIIKNGFNGIKYTAIEEISDDNKKMLQLKRKN
jgi:hypothetical protein